MFAARGFGAAERNTSAVETAGTARLILVHKPPRGEGGARVMVATLMPGDVRDAYVAGRGSMMATMFGAYSMVDQSGTPQLASGALQRDLGEAVWFPTVLLPGRGVT